MDTKGLSSFLLGLGAGVAIGMLFAPKSGQETRELHQEQGRRRHGFLEAARRRKCKQTAAEWVDKGKEALGKQKDNLADAMEAGRQAYRDAVGPQPPPAEGPAQ